MGFAGFGGSDAHYDCFMTQEDATFYLSQGLLKKTFNHVYVQ